MDFFSMTPRFPNVCKMFVGGKPRSRVLGEIVCQVEKVGFSGIVGLILCSRAGKNVLVSSVLGKILG